AKIIDNPNVDYRIVRLKEEKTPIGIITFIKRDYLAHHDIGFAFLSDYNKKGYAFEATAALLKEITKDPKHTTILATTLNDNTNSIKLLEKLGLKFLEEITVEKDLLLLYSATADKLRMQ
ncbi:MAG TPA: GNAT family N-acetyltransferase, partial [Flavobacterium sp.]|nr:GNAT family N-acetyltransferase [Flavobacterium sp.]